MYQRKQYLLALSLLCLLVAACASSGQTATPVPRKALATSTTQAQSGDGSPGNGSPSITNTCPLSLASNVNCQTPQSMREAYGLTSLLARGYTGKGQTIVDIVSFGSPTLQQDMDVFDQQFGLPPITVQQISPLNEPVSDPRGDRAGWADETTLDVQIMHALAPDANIVVLVSPVAETEGTFGLPEFRQLIQYTLDHKLGNIVSQSFGASEATLKDANGQAEIQKWTTLYQQATTQKGLTFFSSSGDNGATDYTDTSETQLASTPTTSFPADDPWVTSVGGTTLHRDGNVFSEVAWSQSGGGFSKFFAQPTYQQTLPASVQSLMQKQRGVPDVSGDADPNTGLAMYENGNWNLAGGTSASAPLWAAVMAIADQMAGHPLGFINSALYKIASSNRYQQDFRDITVGNNSSPTGTGVVQGYNAAPGWDAITGLGTPNAANLLPDLIANT